MTSCSMSPWVRVHADGFEVSVQDGTNLVVVELAFELENWG